MDSNILTVYPSSVKHYQGNSTSRLYGPFKIRKVFPSEFVKIGSEVTSAITVNNTELWSYGDDDFLGKL